MKSFLYWFIWSGTNNSKSEAIAPLTPPPPVRLQNKPSQAKKHITDIVASHEDLKYINPIRYAYDPVSPAAPYLNPILFFFPSQASRPCPQMANSVRIYPLRGGLPYRSSLDYVRGCKHFRANIQESTDLLQGIMRDKSAGDIPVGTAKITLSKLAKHELRPGIEDRMMLATNYMFPFADARRVKIIAVLMIMYFIFDDKVEETPEGAQLNHFRNDFLNHFQDPGVLSTEPTSDFHRHTRETMTAIWEEDGISGNGGREMIEALRDAFRCVHPNGDFTSVEDYLQFRRLNVGARFVIAAAKFTIKSSVDVKDPRLSRYLGLIGDHLGIINDMASFDKESRALEQGETQDMINVASVIQKLLSLQSMEAAKAASYAYQLQVEYWIMEEIKRLEREEDLTDEEWWFLEAVFLTATGNTFFCMTSARYGGQCAAIDPSW
nr:(+)-alpha-trans-bergamotene synthase NsBERS [Nectria sp. HLS206]